MPMKLGIIGAGQLGRMLALAGYPLGLRCTFLDHSHDAPGAQVGEIIVGEFSDPARLEELASRVDLLTFDVENVPSEAVRPVAQRVRFLPPPPALETSQDRLSEKGLFRMLGIDTPDYLPVDTLQDLHEAVGELGLPCVLKTRRLGYDGRGQRVLRTSADLDPAWGALGGVPLIAERFVSFEREVSIIGVRSTGGETAHYPLTANVHHEGILMQSVAPFEDAQLSARARDYLERVMTHFDYAGVLTIEFFVLGGRLLANEMAPRVHNSGHWTIEGAVTSQFENHIRALLGLPLGDTAAVGHSAMVNFIGELPELATMLRIRGLHYHDYGKTPRPGRKLGHGTVTATDAEARDEGLAQMLALLG